MRHCYIKKRIDEAKSARSQKYIDDAFSRIIREQIRLTYNRERCRNRKQLVSPKALCRQAHPRRAIPRRNKKEKKKIVHRTPRKEILMTSQFSGFRNATQNSRFHIQLQKKGLQKKNYALQEVPTFFEFRRRNRISLFLYE